MEKICIFTDTCSDLSLEQMKYWNIKILPIQIQIDGKTYREYFDISPEEYWQVLLSHEDIPATSQVGLEDFLNLYKEMKEEGYTHCVGILINGKGSGTYQTANVVRDMFYEEYGKDMIIELIDSECYTYMYGSIVVQGAKMRSEGKAFDEIVAVMRSRVKCTEAYLGVYSLRHLKKSGRISGGTAFVGEALGLRPISLVRAGSVDVCAKVRGDKNLVPKMVEMAKARAVDREHQTAYVIYAAVPKETIQLAEKLLLEAGFASVECRPMGMAVQTNAGPKSIAVVFRGVPRD